MVDFSKTIPRSQIAMRNLRKRRSDAAVRTQGVISGDCDKETSTGAMGSAPCTPGASVQGRDQPTSPSGASSDGIVGATPRTPPARVPPGSGRWVQRAPGRVPDAAINMQHSLLKRISGFQSKEELLDFLSRYHCLLDLINLVTCLYRLAKMSKEVSSRGRTAYLSELQRHPTFQLLLRSISGKLLQGHLNYLHTSHEGLKGIDGRCLANLTWALAKLDLAADEDDLTTFLATMAAPFVVRCLDSCSPQGLANMLWAYAKLPVAPSSVVNALVTRITELLAVQNSHPEMAATFDAQALSNSVWALAHLRGRGADFFDPTRSPGVLAFVNELAAAAAVALRRMHATPPAWTQGRSRLPEAQRYLAAVEREFSCQALTNIAWAVAALLGGAASGQQQVAALLLGLHAEALLRLRCTVLVLSAGAPLPYAGFNEQALSNTVFAFERVGMLSCDLLSAVFEVAALRLQRSAAAGGAGHAQPPAGQDQLGAFKAQEICTLLKACHSGAAPPWGFLGALLGALAARPHVVENWSAAERAELQRGTALYAAHEQQQAQLVATTSTPPMSQAPASPVAARLSGSSPKAAAAIAAADRPGSAGLPAAAAAAGLGYGGPQPPCTPGASTALPLGLLFGGSSSSPASPGPPSFASGSPRRSNGSATMVVLPAAAQHHVGGVVAPTPTSTCGQLSPSPPPLPPPLPGGLGASMLMSHAVLATQRHAAAAAAAAEQANVLAQAQLGGEALECPLCGMSLAAHGALAHVDMCAQASSGVMSGLAMQRQQQQLQQQQQQVQQQQQQQLQQQHAFALWALQLQQAQQQPQHTQHAAAQDLHGLLLSQQQWQHTQHAHAAAAGRHSPGLWGAVDDASSMDSGAPGAIDGATIAFWMQGAAAAAAAAASQPLLTHQ